MEIIINNEQLMNVIVSHWTLETSQNLFRDRIIKRCVRKFWPSIAYTLDMISLSLESKNILEKDILQPIIFENSHLSIGISTSKYICLNCDKVMPIKIINEYEFNKD